VQMKGLDESYVRKVIEDGADKARFEASKNIKDIKRLLKLI
jgi:hypothetical protein